MAVSMDLEEWSRMEEILDLSRPYTSFIEKPNKKIADRRAFTAFGAQETEGANFLAFVITGA
jgi:hypothetical protein